MTLIIVAAICQALGVLGYKNAYHMTTVGPNGHHDKWVAALEAKFENKGDEFGKKELDDLLQNFDVGYTPAYTSSSQACHVSVVQRLTRVELDT